MVQFKSKSDYLLKCGANLLQPDAENKWEMYLSKFPWTKYVSDSDMFREASSLKRFFKPMFDKARFEWSGWMTSMLEIGITESELKDFEKEFIKTTNE